MVTQVTAVPTMWSLWLGEGLLDELVIQGEPHGRWAHLFPLHF